MKSIDVLLAELRQLDVQLWVEGDRLRYRVPKGAISPELLAEMREQKVELLSFLQQANGAFRTEHSSIVPVPRNSDLPLSISQKGLWLQSQLEPDSPITNMPYAFRFRGVLNVAVLEQSQNEIIRRHEILRTAFPSVDGQPSLAIAPELTLSIPIVDLREFPPDRREVEAKRLANVEVRRPFVISQRPLLRLKLLRLDEEDHILIFNMHRIICDGTSSDIFFRELIALYQAFSTHQPTPLVPLPIQYADFAHWQRQWLQGEVFESQLTYWKQQLRGNLPIIQLPTDYSRPPLLTSQGDRFYRILPKSLNEALNALSQRSGCTLFMTLVAAFQVLLYCYIEQEEILVSYTIAGREQIETEDLIGPLSNTLVLRSQLSENLRFRDFLDQVMETALEADAYQNIPFEALLEEVMRSDGNRRGRSPLTRLFFALLPSWKGERGLSMIDLPGLTITNLFGYVHIGQTKFDLTLAMRETDFELQAIIEYNADIFKESTIVKILKDFQTILEAIVFDPDSKIGTLALLTPKFDRPALPTPDQTKLETEESYIAPRNELERKLTEIWEELLGIHLISIRDNFFALGGSSLLVVRLFARIEEVFQTRLQLGIIMEASTIEDLAVVLKRNLQKVPEEKTKLLFLIQPEGKLEPLFCVHGGYGGIIFYKDLAKYLGNERPVYGIESPWFMNRLYKPTDIVNVANAYIEQIREVQPHGPYYLCGYSFGGLVAFEMACQLEAEGEEVAYVVLLDTSNPRRIPRRRKFFERMKVSTSKKSLGEKLKVIWQRGISKISLQYVQAKERLDEMLDKPLKEIDGGLDLTTSKGQKAAEHLLLKIGKEFEPKVYRGKLLLFLAKDRDHVSFDWVDDLGWKEVVPHGLSVVQVEGNHATIMEEPKICIIAEHLRQFLNS
jgi:thioesterase domain-containing protein